MSYTKGPWEVFNTPSGYKLIERKVENRVEELESVARITSDNETEQANADLIAAAPELLEWIKGVVVQMEYELPHAMKAYTNGESGLFGMRHNLKKVIAKAEGAK